MSQLLVDGASCDNGKKVLNIGELCPAVAMVRFSLFSLSDFRIGSSQCLPLTNFLIKSMKCTFTVHFQTNIIFDKLIKMVNFKLGNEM